MSANKREQEKRVEGYTRALIEAARAEGRLNADLIQWQHARKFSPEVLETLDTLSSQFGASIYLVERVDPSILGGIVVETRGHRYDASVRAQLTYIKNKLSLNTVESEM